MTRTRAKAARLNDLVERLRLRPHGVAELAAYYDTTRRTIERDLEDLRELGYPLDERDHRYALPGERASLNEVEALAVHSATRLLQHTRVGERHYRRAMEKLAQQVPEPARGILLRGVEDLATSPEDRTLDLVAQAWFQSRVLSCVYHGARSGSERRLDLEVWFFELNRRNMEPYVVAFDRTYARELRVYKLSRMEQVRLKEDRYTVPDDFDPLAHMKDTWGVVVGEPLTVRVRVRSSVAFWFEESDDRDQGLEIVARHDDGSLDVDVIGQRAADGDAHELVSFLLSWGPLIEVLAPDDVRTRIAEAHRAAAAAYAGD
jgi:predicted DNA-binding transcriptional regulator YafY